MKNLFSSLRGVAVLAALLLAQTLPSLADSEIELEAIQITPHGYYFQGLSGAAEAANKGFMSNAGFVVTDDGVVVFDALGTPPLGAAMRDAITAITDQPIRRVIVSHYHADHIYGLQELKEAGAEIWAHTKGQIYLNSGDAEKRLEQRREALPEWVDEDTRLVPADRWLTFDEGDVITFDMGGLSFELIDVSGGHSPEDIMMYVPEEKLLFAGDVYASGRIPFVGEADSKVWLEAMDRMLEMQPEVVVPGHGAASRNVEEDVTLSRDYLIFLRQEMGAAVDEMTDFESAYQATDWSAFEDYPAFEEANRINAYGQYLQLERESLGE